MSLFRRKYSLQVAYITKSRSLIKLDYYNAGTELSNIKKFYAELISRVKKVTPSIKIINAMAIPMKDGGSCVLL